jgi:hypothetical protein
VPSGEKQWSFGHFRHRHLRGIELRPVLELRTGLGKSKNKFVKNRPVYRLDLNTTIAWKNYPVVMFREDANNITHKLIKAVSSFA